ncbi:MAG: tetratricopeptide repeat protein [Saprospiraceae bacterium]|nr:tetratricopeptide repeat protein [Saprospiraceae bacterium]
MKNTKATKAIAKIAVILVALFFSNGVFANNSDQLIKEARQAVEDGIELIRNGQKYETAKLIFNQALTIAEQQKHLLLEIEALRGMGLALYFEGQYEQSFNILDSIATFVPTNKPGITASINKIQGDNLVFLGQYSRAYEHQLKAQEYYKTVGNQSRIASMTFSIANNFFYQELYDMAKKEFENSLALYKEIDDTRGIFSALGAIGSCNEYLGNFEEAIAYSEQSLSIAYQLGNKADIAWTQYNIGSISSTAGDLKKAQLHLDKALASAKEIEDMPLIGYTLEALTVVNRQLGHYKAALVSLDQSFQIAQSNNDKSNIPGLLKLYSELYFELKDYEASKNYIDKYIALKDSLRSEELAANMGNLKKDFEIKEMQKLKQIELLKKDAKINRFRIIIGVSIATLFGLALFFMFIFTRAKSNHVKEKNDLLLSKNQEILRQNEILKSSNQDLKQYAYVISHDLKEPLRNISSFTSLLKRRLKGKLDENTQDYMDYITNGVNQMTSLLTDLLEYSKIRKKKHEVNRTDPNEVIDRVIESMQFKIEDAQAEIEVHNLPQVVMEENHFYQVMLNLISNGLKFRGEARPKVKVTCKQVGEQYVFSVSDNGIGIDPEFHDKIFVVFQRLHNRGEFSGSGIGLSTCKKIINDYGGQIWVDSNPDEGSTFHFTIPKTPVDLEDPVMELPEINKESNLVLSA